MSSSLDCRALMCAMLGVVGVMSAFLVFLKLQKVEVVAAIWESPRRARRLFRKH